LAIENLKMHKILALVIFDISLWPYMTRKKRLLPTLFGAATKTIPYKTRVLVPIF
jgi:hypothetical protein